MSRITVGIAGRERRYAHLSRCDIRPSVADSVSGGHVANESDSRFPGQHRSQKFLEIRKRRNAVKHESGTYDVERWIGEGEHARARQDVRLVIARKFGTHAFHESCKLPKLRPGEIRVLIRDRQMRGKTVNLDVRQRDNSLKSAIAAV